MTHIELEALKSFEAQQFLLDHKDDSPQDIALKFQSKSTLPVRALAEQIACRKKATIKLPSLAQTQFVYEPSLLEQCSSESTANYKASLFKGALAIDLTAGLGIDSIAFSKSFSHVIGCELDHTRAGLLQSNLKTVGIETVEVVCGDSIEFIGNFEKKADLIFIDPQRRNQKGRHIGFSLCSPDIKKHLNLLLTKTHHLLIKASPLFEPLETVRELSNISSLTVVSYRGECKELLIALCSDPDSGNSDPVIKAVAIDRGGLVLFEYSKFLHQEFTKNIATNDPSGYVYEPDPSIIKARLTGKVAVEFKLGYVNKSTDYLTGTVQYNNFPGRTFKINRQIEWNRNAVQAYIKENGICSGSIARRDFPMDPIALRKMLKINEGGSDVLIFTKDRFNHNCMFHCTVA